MSSGYGSTSAYAAALQREQPHLRPVAVGEHEPVALRHGRERLGGDPNVCALGARRHGLTAPEQSVSAQRHEHEATLVRHCDWFCGPTRVPTIRP